MDSPPKPSIALPARFLKTTFNSHTIPATGIGFDHLTAVLDGLQSLQVHDDTTASPATPEPVQAPLELPQIPVRLLQTRDSDSLTAKTPSPQPAIIAVYDQDGILLGNFGTTHYKSNFRLRPICMTTFPTLHVNVRESVANEEVARANLELDSDYVDGLVIEVVSTDDARVREQLANAADAKVQVGLVTFRLAGGYIPPLAKEKSQPFSPGSEPATFLSCLARATAFKIIATFDKAASQADFRTLAYIMNDLRCLGAEALPRNDWLYSREDSYDHQSENPFISIVNNSHGRLPVQPWLQQPDTRISLAYPVQQPYKAPRTTFPSMKMYRNHFVPALLFERAYAQDLIEEQYNESVSYDGFVQHLDERRLLVSIKLTADSLDPSRPKIVPDQNTPVKVCFGKVDAKNAQWYEGKVCSERRPGADFTVDLALAPEELEEMHRPADGEWVQVVVIVKVSDFEIRCKMLKLLQATALPRAVEPTTPVNGLPRGKFDIHNLIGEMHTDVYSLEWLAHQDNQQIRDSVEELVRSSPLNNRQAELIRRGSHGVVANTLVLEGFPGSGKSFTLALFVASLLLQDIKIAITAHSNQGVSELFHKICELLERNPTLQHLSSRCVRMHSASQERVFESTWQSGLDDAAPDRIPTSSLTGRTIDYMRRHPRDRLVQLFDQFLTSRRLGDMQSKPAGCKMTFPAVRKALHDAVLAGCLLFAVTTSVGSRLDEYDVEVQALIIDEAAQAGEPDAIAAIQPHTRLDLLVLAGDIKQLGPVVQSHTAGKNPYSNILTKSLMTRVVQAYPDVTRVQLNINYRSHPSIVALASQLFYNSDMHPGRHDWNTRLSQTVLAILREPGVARAIDPSVIAQDKRQVFFNVRTHPRKAQHGSSWANPGGVQAIAALVTKLVRSGVDQTDIAIISMYKDDLHQIVETLRVAQHGKVEVATVDAFQGREKPIVIVHFVAAFTHGDNPFGFVSNPNRLCVALSRAKEYQFLFGNFSFWQEQLRRSIVTNRYDKSSVMRKLMTHANQEKEMAEWNRVRLG